MKKWSLLLVVGMMAMMLAACGEDAEEVYSKALEASENMESADIALEMQQNMDSGDAQPVMDIDSTFDVQMTMDPLAMYMDGTTSLSMANEELAEGGEPIPGSEQDIEMYMVDDSLYMFNEPMGGWLKMNDAGMDTVEQLAGEEPDPAEQMDLYKDYIDDFTFEKNDDTYTLALDADGEDFNELFQKIIEEDFSDDLLDTMDEDEQEVLKNTEINSLALEIEVDKDNYDVVRYTMDMDMTMEESGQEMNITQKLHATYSNINDVDLIEVPDDVKDGAMEQ